MTRPDITLYGMQDYGRVRCVLRTDKGAMALVELARVLPDGWLTQFDLTRDLFRVEEDEVEFMINLASPDEIGLIFADSVSDVFLTLGYSVKLAQRVSA